MSSERGVPRRQLAGLACLVVLTTSVCAPVAAASPRDARFIELEHNTSGGDDRLDVVLKVKTGAHDAPCQGTVRLAPRRRQLLRLTTGAEGGGRWRWEVASGAPAGRLRATVRCTIDHREVSETVSFEVQAGPNPSAPFTRIDRPGSMVAGP